MRLALYQPDIAGNVGTILRLAACLGVPVEIIMPCGFPLSDRELKRAAMDYGHRAQVARHASADAFFSAFSGEGSRFMLLSAHGETRLEDAAFRSSDILLFGSESAGAPPEVHERADARLRIPMEPGFRSLNIALAAGIALFEAMRQTGTLPR